MSMFARPGSWSLHSETDPRWNACGHVEVLMVTYGCPEAEAEIERLKKLYGEPPADLRLSAYKD